MDIVQVQEKERVEGRHVSLYPSDWAIVLSVAKDMGLTVSAAVRYVVRDWMRLQRQAWRDDIQEACRRGLILEDEVADALLLLGDDGQDG